MCRWLGIGLGGDERALASFAPARGAGSSTPAILSGKGVWWKNARDRLGRAEISPSPGRGKNAEDMEREVVIMKNGKGGYLVPVVVKANSFLAFLRTDVIPNLD